MKYGAEERRSRKRRKCSCCHNFILPKETYTHLAVFEDKSCNSHSLCYYCSTDVMLTIFGWDNSSEALLEYVYAQQERRLKAEAEECRGEYLYEQMKDHRLENSL